MRILYYDCFAGISGDMNLGALLDAGVLLDHLQQELAGLGLSDAYELHVSRTLRQSIVGTQVQVILKNPEEPSRSLPDIEQIITNAQLSPWVKKRALNVFRKLAMVEGRIHNQKPETVLFHEVGAIDALVDVVGGIICLEALAVDEIWVSPVELGSGWTSGRLMTLPVPGPATVALLEGIPVRLGGMPFEATTPTGAALLACLGTRFGQQAEISIERVGYGVGAKEAPTPNVLRVFLGQAQGERASSQAYLLETNIDDMNPEWYGYLENKLWTAGVADVFRTPILMKKGRQATMVSVLVPDRQTLNMARDILFAETTTIGLRWYPVQKEELPRRLEVCQTPWGPVRVKSALKNGHRFWKPEYDDCCQIAEATGLPLYKIYEEVLRKELLFPKSSEEF